MPSEAKEAEDMCTLMRNRPEPHGPPCLSDVEWEAYRVSTDDVETVRTEAEVEIRASTDDVETARTFIDDVEMETSRVLVDNRTSTDDVETLSMDVDTSTSTCMSGLDILGSLIMSGDHV